MALDAQSRQQTIEAPYDMAAGLLMLDLLIVGVFYCLDALHGERRDRSMLFWKSLPVSDLTTVLAKASIPLVDSAAADVRHQPSPRSGSCC